MSNNSFCKVAILLFVVANTQIYPLEQPFFEVYDKYNLLKKKHEHELCALRAERLCIGKSLLPKFSFSLGQTLSSHESDIQFWGAFSLKGPLFDPLAGPKLELVKLSQREAKLSHALELKSLQKRVLRSLVMFVYNTLLEELYKETVIVSISLEKLGDSSLNHGIICQHHLDKSSVLKLQTELENTTLQKDFYKQDLPEKILGQRWDKPTLLVTLLDRLQISPVQDIVRSSDLTRLRVDRLDAQQALYRRQYLPALDFGITTSNNHLYFFHKDWNVRAGVTLRWDFFDFGYNSGQAEALENRAELLGVDLKIAQKEENKVDALFLAEAKNAAEKIKALEIKFKESVARVEVQNKLYQLGRIGRQSYLLFYKTALSDQIIFIKDELVSALSLLV